jgi:hypothetical protein
MNSAIFNSSHYNDLLLNGQYLSSGKEMSILFTKMKIGTPFPRMSDHIDFYLFPKGYPSL